VLRDAPAFPKVKVRSQPRGSFSVAEYRTMWPPRAACAGSRIRCSMN
jgi:hypothetical protein